MKLTIVETGKVPAPLRSRFGSYPTMFEHMFDQLGAGFSCQTVSIIDGEPLPDAGGLSGVIITGSPAGVYEEHAWLAPLRQFIRQAYERRIPMLGVCFGHQVVADALGGEVRKSEKGWGLGRHVYELRMRPDYMRNAPGQFAIACSHQDQVITAPAEAELLLASPFTPNAGLIYRNGAALSLQAHPEFSDDYSIALTELRRGTVPEEVVETALNSMDRPSNSRELAHSIGQFFKGR